MRYSINIPNFGEFADARTVAKLYRRRWTIEGAFLELAVALRAEIDTLIGTLEFIVQKDLKLKWPRAETPSHYIVMGLDKDLTEAAKLATREAIDFLTTEKKLTPDDAYMLSSVGVDFRVTQVVDGTKGVHGMIPKAIFKGK